MATLNISPAAAEQIHRFIEARDAAQPMAAE